MSWARLDDRFDEHPKIVDLSDRAFRAAVQAILYCARHLTDGKLPRAIGDRFAGDALEELTGRDLWHLRAPKGAPAYYDIHDYLDYNPTREEALKKRRANQLGRQLGGRARAASAERNQGRFSKKSPAGNQLHSWGSAGHAAPAENQPRTRTRTRTRDPVSTTTTRAGNGEPAEIPEPEPDAWPWWIHEIEAKVRREEPISDAESRWLGLAESGEPVPQRLPRELATADRFPE